MQVQNHIQCSRSGRHEWGLERVSYYVIPVPGVIRTVTPLDREAVPHYWLTVAAEDHGLVPKYTTVQVYLLVFYIRRKISLHHHKVPS